MAFKQNDFFYFLSEKKCTNGFASDNGGVRENSNNRIFYRKDETCFVHDYD